MPSSKYVKTCSCPLAHEDTSENCAKALLTIPLFQTGVTAAAVLLRSIVEAGVRQ